MDPAMAIPKIMAIALSDISVKLRNPLNYGIRKDIAVVVPILMSITRKRI